ncbi:MAG: sugar transferase, partial [Erysipelotrichaceae bacterium]|nr:sugar transferase [Erysipelotrichaceae bacterium]
FDVEAEEREIGNVGMYNTVRLNSYSFSTSQRFYFVLKRILDVIFSILGCILLIPVYLIIRICYLLSGDRFPIVYKHTRIGLDGKPFELYKFRSMIHNADAVLEDVLKDKDLNKEWQENQKLENDPRITKVGRFIRKTSIDEMPQFINVLKGEMSVIGPRPLVPDELVSKNGIKLYERVKPGITGWWACNGRSNMSYEERLEHEYYYVRNCSLSLDILCVLRTIYVVIFEKGAK